MARLKILACMITVIFMAGCVPNVSKKEAFPEMYTNNRFESVIIVPVINKTTAAEASDYLNATVAQPLADKGYYVLSVPIISDIFKQSGVIDGAQLKDVPVKTYQERFGADAVLFISLTNWETNYIVVGGNVTVGMEYVLVSTTTGKVLWSYANTLIVDTGGSSGNIIADIIATAINTAMTDYIPIARRVHDMATTSLPVGKYHPKAGKDGEIKNVNPQLVTLAEQHFKQ